MREIRIGVFDKEREYVEILSSYLSEYSRRKWRITGYTNPDIITKSIKGNKTDIFISTNMGVLQTIEKNPDKPVLIYLSEEQEDRRKDNIHCIYRFQSAKTIGGEIKKVIMQQNKRLTSDILFVAIYSPVGRCGKTSLAYELTKKGEYGKWLYLGMEDYSSMESYSDTGDFLYFVKEQKEEKILSMVENSNGKITVGQGAFENRCFDQEDMRWLRHHFKQSSYTGVVADIGTGSMKNLTVLSAFDWVLVPYIENEIANCKMENFEKIIQLYGEEDRKEQMIFLNMEQEGEVWKKINEIFLKEESG